MDVRAAQPLDVVPGRSGQEPTAWLERQGPEWHSHVRYATLDLSGPYRAVFTNVLPDATQIADPFHMVKLANAKFDECRRRVQNELLGHRGRKHDPLYRARRLLTNAEERLSDDGREKRLSKSAKHPIEQWATRNFERNFPFRSNVLPWHWTQY